MYVTHVVEGDRDGYKVKWMDIFFGFWFNCKKNCKNNKNQIIKR